MSITNPPNPIFIIDDEISVLRSIDVALRSLGFTNIVTEQDSRKALAFIDNNPVEMVLLDLTMPHLSGLEILKYLKEEHPDISVIVITGLDDINTAVQCMRSGAVDYLLKPLEPNHLANAVRMIVNLKCHERQHRLLKKHLLNDDLNIPKAFECIITQDKRILSIFKYIEAVSISGEPILIFGETGSGKELFAKGVHNVTGPEKPFVPVNVAGLDDNMFTDTLFGHQKGAFTNAVTSRAGLIEKAKGGVLFLDEIGDLSIQSQVKLLRLIQDHQYYPLGSDTPRYSQARIVVATNRNLQKMIMKGAFRKDLYYRLSVHQVSIPPLRERTKDLPLLTRYFLKEACDAMNKKVPAVPPELYQYLKMYQFPGNIRELRSLFYDAISQHQAGVLSLKVFKQVVGSVDNNDLIESEQNPIYVNLSSIEHLPSLKEIEKAMIKEAIRRAEGNQSLAARYLGITRQTLKNKLKPKQSKK